MFLLVSQTAVTSRTHDTASTRKVTVFELLVKARMLLLKTTDYGLAVQSRERRREKEGGSENEESRMTKQKRKKKLNI